MKPRDETPERKDSLIDEVRAVRKGISDRVDDDFDNLGEYLRVVGHEYRTKTGRFQPKPPSSATPDRS